jgi:hypothetical protein
MNKNVCFIRFDCCKFDIFFYKNDQIEDEMGRECGRRGGEEACV